MTARVLMYHSVAHDRDDGPVSPFKVSRSSFGAQLSHLRTRGYRTPPLDEGITSGADADVLITFDDGYLDNYTVAFPLLQEHGLRASLFVVADFQRRRNFWDDEAPSRNAPLLEPRHMREMAAHGIEFGSHTLTHAALSRLGDVALRRELVDSKHAIEDIIGGPVRHLAYPYGDVDRRTKAAARAAGYTAAFGVNSGPLRPATDRFEIRRVLVGDSANVFYLHSKLLGFEKFIRWAYWSCRPTAPPPMPEGKIA